MSGYTVIWKPKAPKAILPKEVKTSNDLSSIEKSGSMHSHFSGSLLQRVQLNLANTFSTKTIFSTNKISASVALISITPKLYQEPQVNKIAIHSEDSKKVCPEAKKSLIDGILSIVLPAIIMLLAFALGFGSSGFEILGYLIIGAILGGIIYLIFAILAIVNGQIALNKIGKEPEKYKGTGKATAGIVIALGIVWIPILFWLGYILSRL